MTPTFEKGSCSYPCNCCPIAVLSTLSRVFERVLQPILERPLSLFIPVLQFGFIKGSSCADAGYSLASTILFALDQRAEVQLVALDIKDAFNRVWCKGLLCHLWKVGLLGRAFKPFELYFSKRYVHVVAANGMSLSVSVSAGVL